MGDERNIQLQGGDRNPGIGNETCQGQASENNLKRRSKGMILKQKETTSVSTTTGVVESITA